MPEWRQGAACLALAGAVFSAGCILPFPHVRVGMQSREGRVVDADTGQPLAGAAVTVLDDGRTFRTDGVGRFAVPEKRGWHGAVFWSPALSFSLFPSLDLPSTPRLRVEAPGYAARDEGRAPETREVRTRSLGVWRNGRWLHPVETQRVAAAVSGPSAGGGEIRLRREDRPAAEPGPFSLCFDLEPPEGAGAGKGCSFARVLWWGRDAEMEISLVERVPAADGWAEFRASWRLPPSSSDCVEIALANGRPARLALRFRGERLRAGLGMAGEDAEADCGENPGVRRTARAWAASRRKALAAGEVSFRVEGWEAFGPEESGGGGGRLPPEGTDPRLRLVPDVGKTPSAR